MSDVLNLVSGSESLSPHSPPTDLAKSPIEPNSPAAIKTPEGSPTVTDGEHHKNSTSNEQGFQLAPPIVEGLIM